MYHHSWGTILGMFLFWLVALGGGIWLLARLFPAATNRARGEREHPNELRDPAREIVRQRYARGEITTHEFEKLPRAVSESTSARDGEGQSKRPGAEEAGNLQCCRWSF
jgi:uncharacterized membrane protein